AGLLSDEAVDSLVETVHEKTGETSRSASGYAASNLDVYQVNSTFYDALGRDDVDYLLARAIQFFAPGTPQVYYVGLLAGTNDLELVGKTGVGRDINRHYYAPEEIRAEIDRPVVRSLMHLIRIRNGIPAFAGTFSMPECGDSELILRWESPHCMAQLNVDLERRTATIDCVDSDKRRRWTIGDGLLKAAESGAAI
ncbi:MAG: sucrose phosphorylase, partial [marine benthic group bacterium]|nr:sucrose phosphorylase [Gemmatimonadota bacterium]